MNLYSGGMGIPMMSPFSQGSNQFGGNVSYNVPKYVLYVGNIGNKMTEEQLQSIFRPFNNVSSISVKRDPTTNQSKGFAFVTFTNMADAEAAKTKLNHTLVDKRELKVYFKRSPADFKPEANVFIKNLPQDMSNRELEEICSQFGKIECSTIRVDDDGQSLGYGYVQFTSEAEAANCIQHMNLMNVREKIIEVQKFVPKAKRAKPKQCNLYIKNFPDGWDEARCEAYIKSTFGGKYGMIQQMKVGTDNKLNKKYAFVLLETEDLAQQALKEMNNIVIEDTNEKLYVNLAQNREVRRRELQKNNAQHKNDTNLFIKSLLQNVTEDKITEVFSRYGKITSTLLRDKIVQTKDATAPAKYGYINFETPQEAANAYQNAKTDPEVLKLLNNTIPNYREFLFYHVQKDDRKKQLQHFQHKQNKLDMRDPETMKLFMDYMKKMIGNKGGPQNPMLTSIMQNMGKQMGTTNKPPHQGGPRMNPMMGQGNQMGIPLMPTKSQGMPGAQNMRQQPMMPSMMNPMMMGSQMNAFPGQGMPPYMMGNNMMMPSQIPSMNPAFGMQQGTPHNIDINWILSNRKEFDTFTPDRVKKTLGSILYPLVLKQVNNQELTAKVTGMLIDLEVLTPQEIIEMITNPTELRERIDEALGLIKGEDGM